MLCKILLAETAPGCHTEAADAFVHGKNSSEEKVRVRARIVLDGDTVLLVEDGSDTFYHRDFVANVVDVGKFEAHFTASFGASRLQRGAAGKGSNDVGAPGAEDHADGAFEAGAEGEEDDDGGDAPRHPEHGKSGTATIVLHCSVGFAEKVAGHDRLLVVLLRSSVGRPGGAPSAPLHLLLFYSWRRASTGSSIAALRAGYRPAVIPANERERTAPIAEAGTIRGVSKPCGK